MSEPIRADLDDIETVRECEKENPVFEREQPEDEPEES